MLKSVTYSLLTKLTVGFINFLILVLSSRYLGVVSRGEISIFLLNIMLMQIVNEIYTGYSIIHFIPKFNWRKLVLTGIGYTFIICTLCNAIIIAVNRQLPDYKWSGYALSLLVMLNTFNCVLILGRQNIRLYNILCFIQPFVLLFGVVFWVFVRHQYTFAAYFFPLLISFLVAFIVSGLTLFVKFPLKKQDRQFNLKPILLNGLLYQLGLWMFIFCNRFSYYLLPDNKEVGLYSSASVIAESVLIISHAISPVLISRSANNELNTDSRTILSVAKMASVLSAGLILIICVLPEEFYLLLLGQGFEGISGVLRYYAPGVIMVVFFTILGNFFVAKGIQKTTTMAHGIGFLSSLILAPILISNYGPRGAAYNAILAYSLITIAITSAFLSQNKLNLKDLFNFRADISRIKAMFKKR